MVSDYPPQVDCLGRTAAARHSEEEGKEDNKGHGASGVVIGYAYRKLRWSRKHKKRYIFTTKGKDKKGQARSGEGRLLLKLPGNTRFGLLDRQSGGTPQFLLSSCRHHLAKGVAVGATPPTAAFFPWRALRFFKFGKPVPEETEEREKERERERGGGREERGG